MEAFGVFLHGVEQGGSGVGGRVTQRLSRSRDLVMRR